jgi:hypothetical protein
VHPNGPFLKIRRFELRLHLIGAWHQWMNDVIAVDDQGILALRAARCEIASLIQDARQPYETAWKISHAAQRSQVELGHRQAGVSTARRRQRLFADRRRDSGERSDNGERQAREYVCVFH